MEPTRYEEEILQTVKNLIYVYGKLKTKPSDELIRASKSVYFTKEEGDKWVAKLCGILTPMPEKEKQKIIYNAKSAEARKVADWWEEHQEADRKREAEEKQAKKDANTRKKALAKLTDNELRVLGLKRD
jgi:superfamily II DNA/RNA helicase